MLNKIKTWLIAGLAVISAVLYGLLNRSKRKFSQYKERQAKAVLDAERDAQEVSEQARIEEEREVKDALSRADKSRDHFE